MELNLQKNIKQIIAVFILILLPFILIAIGAFANILNAWYFIGMIVWFGMGIIFFNAVN